jgi:hypothetical protein
MVKLEIFSGDPPCPGCVAIIELAERVAAKYPGELEMTVLKGQAAMDKFERYKLFCVQQFPLPAISHPGRVAGVGLHLHLEARDGKKSAEDLEFRPPQLPK